MFKKLIARLRDSRRKRMEERADQLFSKIDAVVTKAAPYLTGVATGVVAEARIQELEMQLGAERAASKARLNTVKSELREILSSMKDAECTIHTH